MGMHHQGEIGSTERNFFYFYLFFIYFYFSPPSRMSERLRGRKKKVGLHSIASIKPPPLFRARPPAGFLGRLALTLGKGFFFFFFCLGGFFAFWVRILFFVGGVC